MANYLLEALKRQKLAQMSHQPQPLPPDLLGMMSNAESKLYDRSMIYKAMKDAVTAPGRAYRGEIDALGDPYGAMEEAMNTAGMAQLGGIPGGARGPGSVGMITYHGSPHKFDKFDMSKIGTGEGAQAYGHGLYMAEAPDVAKTYGRSNTPGNRQFNSVRYNGQEFPAGSRDGELLYDITIKGRAAVIENLQRQADRLATINPKESANLLDRIAYAKTVKPDNVQIDAGNLYKVDIPDEAVARMLDWDKPLSQQAQNIRDALPQVGVKSRGDAYGWHDNLPMGQAYRQIEADFGNADKARQAMAEVGIPGIRYLDGGSRTAGDGTSNFVLFDDQLPRILERNGEATGLQPWKPGEANALLGIPSARPRNALGQEIPPTQYEAGFPDYLLGTK